MANFTGLAFTTCVVVVGSTEAKLLAEKKPLAMKPVIGGFMLGIFLFAIGMANESIATKMCALIIVTALLLNGIKLFEIMK